MHILATTIRRKSNAHATLRRMPVRGSSVRSPPPDDPPKEVAGTTSGTTGVRDLPLSFSSRRLVAKGPVNLARPRNRAGSGHLQHDLAEAAAVRQRRIGERRIV